MCQSLLSRCEYLVLGHTAEQGPRTRVGADLGTHKANMWSCHTSMILGANQDGKPLLLNRLFSSSAFLIKANSMISPPEIILPYPEVFLKYP